MTIKNLKLNIKKTYESIAFNKLFLKASRFLYFTKTNPKALDFKKNDRCILLAPHPDDETFGCGGLLCNHPQNFHVVCLTDGQHGNIDKNPNHTKIKSIREKEFEAALKVAGIASYEFLGIEDRKLIENFDKFKTIDFSNYDYIFIPYFMDNHKDHKAVQVLFQKMLRTSSSFKKNVKIVLYEIWSALPVFNYYKDITFIYDKKQEMINCYKSQLQQVGFLDGIKGLNAYRGTCTNVGSSEAFCVIDLNTFLKI